MQQKIPYKLQINIMGLFVWVGTLSLEFDITLDGCLLAVSLPWR
jgi:hypothetical protein